MKEKLSELVTHIDHIGNQIDNFQTRLASYFKDLAIFDRKKADIDLGDAKEYWINHERQVFIMNKGLCNVQQRRLAGV